MSISISKDLVGVIKASNEKGTKPYDTQATVTRVEGQTAWVHIPGGVDETPVKRTISAKKGDVVQIRVSGGSAFILGNASSPPTDDTQAFRAQGIAGAAKEIAEASEREAKRASLAADSAEKAAGRAWDKAGEAETAADEAKDAAREANKASSGALTQLSVVEDVVGTLSWISEHGTYVLTQDTEVIPGKHYFEKQGDVYNIIINPSGDPSSEGYFELSGIDEAITNYVSTHLALTNEGLWVVNDTESYKVLLSSEGMKVFDSQGLPVSMFGESIEFSSTRPQHIGGDDAYITFYDSDNDGVPDAINIGGSNVTVLGNRSLADIASACDVAEEDRDYIRQHFKMDEDGFTVSENLNGSETGVRVVLKGDRLSFYHGPAEVAYISDQRLYISQSVVLQQIDVGIKQTEVDIHGDPGKGQWSWKVHENANGENNLYLKWLG